MNAELTETTIPAYIEKVLAQAPPLTDEQRHALAELLAPIRQRRTGGAS